MAKRKIICNSDSKNTSNLLWILKYFYILLAILIVGQSAFAIDYSTPHDLPTLEALINLHKEMKKYEKLSLTQVTTVTAEQEVTTDLSTKISDIKTTLNRKMSDINSYLVFATTISDVIFKLKSLGEEYEKFIVVIPPIVVKKPYTADYYYNTHMKIKRSVDRLTKAIGGFSASGINILKASMDEKFKLLYLIDGTINEIRYLIQTSSNYIKYVSREEMAMKRAKEAISNDYKSKLAERLISDWNNASWMGGSSISSNNNPENKDKKTENPKLQQATP